MKAHGNLEENRYLPKRGKTCAEINRLHARNWLLVAKGKIQYTHHKLNNTKRESYARTNLGVPLGGSPYTAGQAHSQLRSPIGEWAHKKGRAKMPPMLKSRSTGTYI